MPSMIAVASSIALAAAVAAAPARPPEIVVPPGSPGAGSQSPATLTLAQRNSPMVVRVVHDARPGCGADCGEWIAAEGQIAPGTRKAFARVLRGLGKRHLPVFIDSGGGSVEDAMAMGQMIRARHLDVAVTQSVPNCPTCDEHAAYPKAERAVCASACVLVLAAGEHRLAATSGLVGVHQMSVHATLVKVRRVFRVFYRTVDGRRREIGRQLLSVQPLASRSFTEPASRATNDKVARYLAGMGVAPGLMPLMLSTPSTSIRWLNQDERTTNALVTRSEGGAILLAKAADGKAPPAAGAHPDDAHPDGALLRFVGATNAQPGTVVWRLDEGPGRAAAIVADVAVPGSNFALSLRLSPDVSSPDRVVADLTVQTEVGGQGRDAIHRVERLWPLKVQTPQGPTELTGEPKATTGTITTGAKTAGDMTWRFEPRPGAAILDPKAPRPMSLRLLFDGGRLADLTIEEGAGVGPLYERAAHAWAAGAAPRPAPRPEAPLIRVSWPSRSPA